MKNQKFKIALAIMAFSAAGSTHINAQRKTDDPKHENHYQQKTIELEDASIYFSGSQSQQEFTLTKLRIVNKGKDYILYKPDETTFKYEFGEFHPTTGIFRGNKVIVLAASSEARTLKVSGGANFHVDKLTIIPKGFNRVASDGTVQDAADFKLPASANDFEAGKFKCYLEELVKETKVTEAVFKVVYQGSEIGIVDPSKVVLKLENGQEFINDNRKDRAVLLLPGEEAKIKVIYHVPAKIADMQFANMLLVWKKTFQESKVSPINLENFDLVLDPAMTAERNK